MRWIAFVRSLLHVAWLLVTVVPWSIVMVVAGERWIEAEMHRLDPEAYR